MAEGFAPIEIFCCFAREDEMWLRKLDTHLGLLKRQGLISLWYDRFVSPGTNWAQEIDAHLEGASVILLLVSSDFFASDYCYGIEMQRALEREAAGEARVVPILVRPTDWTDAPFAHLQALPTDARPIASWRNKDTAFADIAAGIRRVIVEELPQLSASAPRAALPKVWNIPYPRNPFFLGRDAELFQIRQNLHTGQATAFSQPQAISGLGGIGKTQLALEYAYLYCQDYAAVLWARAESTDALVSSYIAVAQLLRLPEREAQEQEIAVQAVKTWLQTHHNWLLILDNADELTLLPDFLPPSLGGHLLLTTRAAATGRLAHRLEIEALPPEDGALFLLRRAALIAPDAELSHVSQERDLAIQISQELGGLPLALDQAGAYLEETGIDLASYWHIYQQHRADLLRQRRGLVADHPAPVATTWALSFQRVEEKNPSAAELLRVCAYLAPDAIAEEILTAGASFLGFVLAPVAGDAFLLNQAIEVLRAYSLLRRDPTGKTFSIHRLVQAVLQDTLAEKERRTWAERAMLAVNAAFPKVEHGTWPQCERLLLQALAATQVIEQYQVISEEAGRLLYETASYLQDRIRYVEAKQLYQRSLHMRAQMLGLEHTLVATSLTGLANLYADQSQYEQAESHYRRALDIQEKAWGPEHAQVAISLSNLANLYREQGKYEQAESLLQRALHIWEQTSELEQVYVTNLLNNLAVLYSDQGRYEKAESFYQRALHFQEQRLEPGDPNVALPLSNLAELYLKQKKYNQAEPLFHRALHIREQALGSQHPLVAHTINGLADLYADQGKYEQAEPLYFQAIHIFEQALGSTHPYVAFSLTGLANLYRAQSKYEQAESLYQRALQTHEQSLGPQHPNLAETMYDLAQLREAQGNSEEARTFYARALAVREQALGVHHPKTMETRTRLIALLHTMGQHEEAAKLEAMQSDA